MVAEGLQRPKFFEGQYLGSADLTAVVEYQRSQLGRHSLGGHTWGIAMGLQLLEKPSLVNPSQVDVFVQPGFAWDGFGRPIALNEPVQVSPELFRDLVYDPVQDDAAASGSGADGRLVPVWLRYVETATQSPRPGFELCEEDDQFSRFQEGFQIVVGERRTAADQRDPVSLAGAAVDAQQALKRFDAAAPEVFDTSVPHQAMPGAGSRANWYVPIGLVRWLPNININLIGSFVALTPADLANSRRRRHYAGLVAEGVQAADGILRLKDRARDASALWTDELVWVEGSLRVEGDVRLFGTRLDWRNVAGQDAAVPLQMMRAAAPGGFTMLQAAIGQDTGGMNRFGVGPLQPGAGGAPPAVAEKLVVLDNGRVGIGTTAPTLALDIRGDFGNPGPATLSLFGSQIGDVGGGILFLRSGGGVVTFDGTDNVGIGSTTPRNPLAIRGTGPAQELISFEDPGGATKWHVNQNVQGKPGLNFAETGIEDGRLFIAAGGNIGIGTTQPGLRLDIQGDFGRANGPSTMSLFGSRIGDVGGGTLFLRSGGDAIVMDGNDAVGIGTGTPITRLHVAGSLNADAGDPASHVGFMDNVNGGSSADVLALRVNSWIPSTASNFITFFGAFGPVGAIQGDSAGGVSFITGGADYAEFLERADVKETLEPGDVVGIVSGRISRTTQGAHHVSVVSRRPIVIANAPARQERERFNPVAFVGQTGVKLRGTVQAGDLVLPSGENDGVAVAKAPAEVVPGQPVIGTAWESSNETGIKLINTAIGLAPAHAQVAAAPRTARRSKSAR
jgi:hypothetical protein